MYIITASGHSEVNAVLPSWNCLKLPARRRPGDVNKAGESKWTPPSLPSKQLFVPQSEPPQIVRSTDNQRVRRQSKSHRCCRPFPPDLECFFLSLSCKFCNRKLQYIIQQALRSYVIVSWQYSYIPRQWQSSICPLTQPHCPAKVQYISEDSVELPL